MALDKEKLEEESAIHRFYKIILAWDYLTLDSEAIHSLSFISFLFSIPKFMSFVHIVCVCVSESESEKKKWESYYFQTRQGQESIQRCSRL